MKLILTMSLAGLVVTSACGQNQAQAPTITAKKKAASSSNASGVKPIESDEPEAESTPIVPVAPVPLPPANPVVMVPSPAPAPPVLPNVKGLYVGGRCGGSTGYWKDGVFQALKEGGSDVITDINVTDSEIRVQGLKGYWKNSVFTSDPLKYESGFTIYDQDFAGPDLISYTKNGYYKNQTLVPITFPTTLDPNYIFLNGYLVDGTDVYQTYAASAKLGVNPVLLYYKNAQLTKTVTLPTDVLHPLFPEGYIEKVDGVIVHHSLLRGTTKPLYYIKEDVITNVTKPAGTGSYSYNYFRVTNGKLQAIGSYTIYSTVNGMTNSNSNLVSIDGETVTNLGYPGNVSFSNRFTRYNHGGFDYVAVNDNRGADDKPHTGYVKGTTFTELTCTGGNAFAMSFFVKD